MYFLWYLDGIAYLGGVTNCNGVLHERVSSILDVQKDGNLNENLGQSMHIIDKC